MIDRQFILPLARELIIDLFAGGGGASTGIEQALGRHVDIAVNHDPEAVSLHQANHPQTLHLVVVCDGRPVGLLWASPDCFPAGTLVLTRDGYTPIEEINVQFMDYRLIVAEEDGIVYLRATYTDPDAYMADCYGRESAQVTTIGLPLLPQMSDDAIVRGAFNCCQLSFDLRVREAFLYKGQKIFSAEHQPEVAL